VAELAGIGASWYTYLEQGRDVRPSEGALRRIARALQLDPTEQRYLLRLALESGERTGDRKVVSGELRTILQDLAGPVLVLSRSWETLYYNEAANALFDFPHLPHNNLLRLIFTPEFRALYTNWEQRAKQLIGIFRLQNAMSLRDPGVSEVVEDLERSPEFGDYWRAQTVREENSGHTTLDHPFAGRLQLNYTMLGVLDSPGLLVELCYCDGEESRRRLADLVRQVRSGERSPDHNLWSALAAKVRGQARYGRVL
jgi:transcriptional regulator with XRE-family HTH domain